jgi:hypothetical protein
MLQLGALLATLRDVDGAWLQALDEAVAVVEHAHPALEAVTPPLPLMALHTHLLEAVDYCRDGALLFRAGVYAASIAQIQSASQLIVECAARLEEVGAALAALQNPE